MVTSTGRSIVIKISIYEDTQLTSTQLSQMLQ